MRNSILSRLRENPKIVKVLVFLTSWTQLHAYANTAYLNKPKETLPGADFHYSTIVQNNSSFLKNNEKSSAIDTALRNNISYSNEKNIDSENIYSPSGNGNKTLIKGQKTIINQPVSGFYISDIKEGIIGKDSEHPIDQIYDNIFNVTVNEKIRSDKQYSLEYDLYGLKDYKQVSKVINDELAVGGQNVEKTTVWAHQTEPVKATSVKEGKNIIIFTIPNSSDYSYKIRNLRIVASDKKSAPAEFANSYVGQTNYKYINSQNQAEELSLNSATLKIEGNSVKNTAVYSITALRDIDMPALTPEMVNVTADHFGYRFLPHGENFSAPAKVSIGYDKSKIPAGYTEQDIKTFYFDLTQKKWIALEKAERDSLQKSSNVIVSKTTHFTDMVNGIIKVPESPETGSYAPNSIKDIKAANPTEGIVSIAPPTANNMGTVNTSFPIKLPAGRGGMQPSLSVNYSSEGGNGWLGLGWDLSIPSISIDTRWGVPTYDPTFESEIYTLGGEQLTFKDSNNKYVLPNRAEGFQKSRDSADREFYPRIEGGYSKIIRKGSNPNNYVWIVTSKDGTRSCFGGDENGNVVENAVLRQPKDGGVINLSCNIGHWALYKTIDTNGNYVVYTYDKSIYGGNPGNGGQELHISEINYTLHDIQNPPKNYKVTFNTVSGREDIQINGRLGFLQIESKRLSSIEVKYGSEKIRSYGFTYRNDDSSFKKSLLESITEKDASDAIFYTNKMEYDKAPATLFGSPQPWTAPDNASFSGLLSSGDFIQGYSMLSGNYSKSTGYSFGVNIGFYNMAGNPVGDQGLFSFRQGTFGAHGSVSNSLSDSKISVIDIDGDNLPDRVYLNNGIIYYSKNISLTSTGTQKFDSIVKVAGLTEVGKSKSSAWGVGINGNFGGGSIGFDYSNSTSTTTSYFMDFNSDGLVDFVKDGKVYFNRLVYDSIIQKFVPTFNLDSTETPYPIKITASNVQTSSSLFDNEDKAEKKKMLEQNPLHDIVRIWVAPKTGTVTVKNTFSLNQLSCSPDEDCGNADGVAVSFQYKSNDPLVQNINAGDYTSHSFADQVINIAKGEKLYFRISSKYDGTLDQVSWNPEITYSVLNNPAVDSDNRNLSVYRSQEDFVNSSNSVFYAGNAGTLNISLNKNIPLSDNAKVIWTINDIDQPEYSIASEGIYNGNINSSPIQLNPNDKVSVRVLTDTQIDWTRFKVIPEFTENQTGDKYYVQVEYTMYNDRGDQYFYTIQSTDLGKKLYAIINNFPTSNFNYEGSITSSLKFVNKLLSKTVVARKKVANSYVNSIIYTNPYEVKQGDVGKIIYIEHTINSKKDFAAALPNLSTTLASYIGNYIDNPGTSTVQTLVNKTGSIYVGSPLNNNVLTLNVMAFLSPDPNSISTAELTVYDDQGNIVANLFADSSQNSLVSTPIAQGTYSYELNVSNGGRARISINNVGTSQTIITSNSIVAHKPIFTPENPSIALASNQYDNRFGLLYRGWGGFVLNGNNQANGNNITENYTLAGNYANGGNITEMKVDETRLALSQVYSQDPGTNPTVNNPTVDNNGNVTINDNDASLSKNYFLTLTSDINNLDKGRWSDVDPSIYINQNSINASRAGVHNIDSNFNNFSLSQTTGSQLSAPSIILRNQSVSVAGGVSSGMASVNASGTIFSEGKSIRNVLDYNGDGFPDDFNKTNVKTTFPLGFLSNAAPLNVGSQSLSRASNSGLSSGFSFVHGNSTRMAFIQPKSGNKDKNAFNESLVNSESESRKAATKLSISGNIEQSTEFTKQTFLDINGDGLPDKYSDGNFQLNIGKQFAGNDSWGNNFVSEGESTGAGLGAGISLFRGSFDFGLSYSSTTSTTSKELIDINGDGLPDKIIYSGSLPTIYLNTGNGISSASLPNVSALSATDLHKDKSVNVGGNVAGTVLIPIPFAPAFTTGLKLNITAGVSKGFSATKSNSTFKDVNGDGYPDFVTSDDTNSVTVQLNQIGTTNLLRKVTTPSGGSWEVEYERVGNTYDMPQSKYVLKTVTTNDGFTGDNAFSPDVSKVTIQYANPYHSRRERTFYGFEKVTVNQIDTKQGGISSNVIYRKTEQTFNNKNYYLKGALLNEKLLDASGKIWTEKNNTYEPRKIHSPNIVNTLLNLEKESEKNHTDYACFVALKNTDSKFYEGLATATKYTSSSITEYDEWGNAVKVTDYGDTQIGSTEIVSSEVTYEEVAPGKYVIAPKTVKNTATGVVREKRAEYDPSTGDLKKMVIKNQGADYSVYDFEYDVYGNITKSTGPANSANQRFFHQYTYDDNVKTYPVKVQDAFGYSSKTQYDFRFGVPTLTEDMNLQPMKFAYDAKARTTEITGPYEMFNNIPWTIKFEYNPITDAPLNATNAQSYAVTKHYNPEYTNSTINTITIADGFGEAIQVKKTGDIYNDGVKYIVAGKVESDAFGRALKTYYPTTENVGSGNTLYNASVDTTEPTINQYDVLDRVVYTKLPGENLFSTIEYGFADDVQGRQMFATTFKDELGSIKKSYTDIKGRTTSVWEVSNTGDIKTKFTHDAIGQILQVEDVAGNITTSQYDDLGRRISYKHPDSGITTYKYDPAGNMNSKTNAANEMVNYKYDYTRLKEVNYPVYPENNVKYYYGAAMDASATDNNAVGRLWYQTDATGTQYLKYGRLGELIYQRRSVAVPDAGVYWFGTSWEYDTWNRVKKITYPDGEEVKYTYNKAGNLFKMNSVKDGFSRDIIKNLGYDKFEQRVYLQYGNGTETTYEYETNRRRLLKMYAKNSNRYFMQNTYQYDVVSNVMQVHNNAPVVQGLLGGGTNYAYGYDDLYRLTSSSGNWRGIKMKETYDSQGNIIYVPTEERHRFTVGMTYDNMHNIMSKTQKHEWVEGTTSNNWATVEPTSYRLNYKYQDPSHPHAPSRIIDEPNLVPNATCCNPDDPGVKFQDYQYDPKGNPTKILQQTCTNQEEKAVYLWDEESRLRFVDTNPTTPEADGAAIYTYDAGGERIIKDLLFKGKIGKYNSNHIEVSGETIHKAAIYPSGLITLNLTYDLQNGMLQEPSYTKHYYAGSQRIQSKNGNSGNVGAFDCAWLIIPFGGTTPPINPVNVSNQILQTATQSNLVIMQTNNLTPPVNYGQNGGYTGNCVSSYASNVEEKEVYWFHPDHLGSSSFITGLDGEVTQNMEYFPSGEIFVENHYKDDLNSQYKFNGKEQDSETGYYYYGARYYNPRVSLWLNVDPLAEKYPAFSPYVYCANNPIRYIDPDGRFLIDVHRRIVENAFKQFMFNRVFPSNDIQAFERAIVGGGVSPYRGSVIAPDVRTLKTWQGGEGMPSVDREHFDNMNYSQIMKNFNVVDNGIDQLISQYKRGKINATALGNGVGEYFHAVADFYSHSNYIELYKQTYGESALLEDIPTLQVALSSKKYSAFAKLLKSDLHTGSYPGNGKGSHEEMNHDLGAGSAYWFTPEVIGKEVNWNSRAAEAVATKATVEYVGKVEKSIK